MPSEIAATGDAQRPSSPSPVWSRPSLFGPWPRWKRACWVALALAVTAWRGPSAIDVFRPDPRFPLDFFQEWASARNYLTGRPVYESQRITLSLYLGLPQAEANRTTITVNAHPPASVLLVLPLGRLSYPDAALVFNLVSMALLLLAIRLVLRGLQVPFSPWDALPAATLLLLSNPFRQQINQGQWDLVLLALFVAAWLGARAGRSFLAGSAVGLAAAIKIAPGFLGLYFLIRRDWRGIAGAALAFAGMTALSGVVLGQETLVAYVRDVVPQVREWRSAWVNASLPGFWSKLFAPGSVGGETLPLVRNPGLATALTVVSCLAVVALASPLVARARSLRQQDWAFALMIVITLLVGPLTWDHAFLLLLLPAVLLWMTPAPFRGHEALLVACFGTMWVGADWYWLALAGTRESGVVVARPWQALTALSFQFYALAVLFAVTAAGASTALRSTARR